MMRSVKRFLRLTSEFHRSMSESRQAGNALMATIIISIPIVATVVSVTNKNVQQSSTTKMNKASEIGAENSELAAALVSSLVYNNVITYDDAKQQFALAAGITPPNEWKFTPGAGGQSASIEVAICETTPARLPKILMAGVAPVLIDHDTCKIGNEIKPYTSTKVTVVMEKNLPDCKATGSISTVNAAGSKMKYEVRFKKKDSKNWGKEANRYISDGLYHDCNKSYDNQMRWGPCPDGMAAFGLDEGDFPSVACGVLPFDDMLSKNPAELHVMRTSEDCLANEVITGALYIDAEATTHVLCSKINTARYKLGSRLKASYWGSGSSGSKKALYKINKNVVPAVMRYTLGRSYTPNRPTPNLDTALWDADGCVGYDATEPSVSQFGFIFVKYNRSPYQCGYFEVAQFQYAGLPGDPPSGTAVNMFPQTCSSIQGDGRVIDGACIP